MISDAVNDVAEQPAMLELQDTYGKVIHTWAPDVHADLPLGPRADMSTRSSWTQELTFISKQRIS